MVLIFEDSYLINYGKWMLLIFPYYPKGQGIMEQVHGTSKQYLHKKTKKGGLYPHTPHYLNHVFYF